MPCASQLQPGQTLAERGKQIDAAIARLEAQLQGGQVALTIGANGAIAFRGWKAEERSGVADVCAYRLLAAKNSFALRRALAGRSVNPQAIAAGVHSHDGGATWSKH